MIWKTLFVAFFATVVLAEYQIPEDRRQQIRSTITEHCKKNGAEDKVEQVENAGKNFVECIKGLIDPQTIQNEIAAARPKGELDVVFKKYCDKSSQFKGCFHSLVSGIEPCMEQRVRDHIGEANSAVDQLIDFVCFKDGDRIALFIAEGGPECFGQKSAAIRDCAENITKSVHSVEAAKALSINEQCGKFDELTTCIVSSLEQCSSPTPANMMDSLFRYIRKDSPCKDVKKAGE
uniref:Venom peptide n=1 Tax=Comana monomorpha TaxID=1555636 RepID=A0AAU6PAU0_9NEOP